MNGQELFSFIVWKMVSLLKEFIVFYLLILMGEWFASKRGFNLFERTWIVTVITLFVLTFVLWFHLGRILLFL